jgi:general secretion pathway protein B
MSFILDALKKSELERQRQSTPGLMDTTLAPRSTRLPLWALALGLLLAINLIVLTYFMTHKAATPTAAKGTSAPASVPAASAAPPARAFSPMDAAPVYAPEIPVAGAGVHDAPPPAPAPSRSVHHADPVLSDADSKAELEVLPTMSEVNLPEAQALPELHLDVHVYATNPSDRFVYVNMRKYHEGAALQEGPVVERIRRDGVVLNYQGLRFLLPRQP